MSASGASFYSSLALTASLIGIPHFVLISILRLRFQRCCAISAVMALRACTTPLVLLAKDSNTVAVTATQYKPLEIDKYVHGHHQTKQSLIESADANCIMCVLLRLNADHPHRKSLKSRVDESEFFSTFEVSFRGDWLELLLKSGDLVSETHLNPVGKEEYDDNVTFKFDNNTDGPRARKMLEQWVGNCTTSQHVQCRPDEARTSLPTRLLKIDNSGGRPTSRLVLRAEYPQNSRYVALSYVWGTGPINEKLRLLHSFFERLRKRMIIDELPSTFRDAMRVAIRLGAQHVWIDSLCILQDSVEDWRAEAAAMQDVYRNAYVTISALAGQNDRAGLFYDRDVALVAPTIVRVKPSSQEGALEFRHALETNHGWRLFFMHGNILISRAWCLQERLLSPRLIHFGANQLFWECRELAACELHPKFVQQAMLASRLLWKPLLAGPPGPAPYDLRDKIFTEWYDCVCMYTQCRLTESSDKLVAISGLANNMRRVLYETWPEKKHRYWFGLWEEDLRTALCWIVSGDKKRSLSYRAPSWSWASIDGIIHTPSTVKGFPSKTWFLSESDCNVHTEDEGQEGNENNSKLLLELTGPCAIIHTHDFGPIKTESGYRKVRCFTDCGSGAELTMPATTPGVYNSEPHIMFDDEEDTSEKALCMPIKTFRRNDNHSGYCLKGLVFSEVIGTGRYRRVGYLTANLATKEAAVNLFEPLQRKTIIVM
jgi:hypothetical protein